MGAGRGLWEGLGGAGKGVGARAGKWDFSGPWIPLAAGYKAAPWSAPVIVAVVPGSTATPPL